MPRSSIRSLSRVCVAAAVFAAVFVLAPPAYAATITVDTLDDELNSDGDCSLREAITATNTNAAVDACAPGQAAPTVDLIDFSVTGTITLTNTLPFITQALTIDGPGAANLTILGGGGVRVMVVVGGNLILEHVTVSNSSINSLDGAGIFNAGTLTVTNSTFSGNSTSTTGGAIANQGTLTVTNSIFSGNSATNSGGGIYNGTGRTLTVTNSTFSGNSTRDLGGGIRNDSTATVTDSTFSGNSALVGGGSYNGTGRTLTVTNSTFSGNSAAIGGGIGSDGTLTVTNSTFSDNPAAGNSGGGIYSSTTGSLAVTDSTFSGNSAAIGGGIRSDGTLTVTNSTFSENIASHSGGGIYNGSGTLTVTNSTFSGNSSANGGGIRSVGTLTVTNSTFSENSGTGGGIENVSPGTATLRNTIVANSFGANCSGGITDGGGNLQHPGTTCGALITSADPKLDPLQDNGGPTETMALQGLSPAIDNAVLANCPATDQRGVSRPQPALGDCDIGAFELEVTNTAPVAVDDAYPTDEDTLLSVPTLGVLDNDDDAEDDALTAALVTGPSNAASFTLDADGSFDYEPVTDFNGMDSFTYMANDGALDSNVATVDITVGAVNDAPTIAVVGGACTSDTAAMGRLDLTVGDVESAASSLTLSATSSNQALLPDANLVLGGSGADKTLTLSAVAGASGSATVTVEVDDGTDTTQIAISVRVGTVAKDTFSGAAGPDAFFGLGGRDNLTGNAGEDLLCGGAAADVLNGDAGDDVLSGGAGDDVLNAGADDDELFGGRGNDGLTGGTGADAFSGGLGIDVNTDFTHGDGDTWDGT